MPGIYVRRLDTDNMDAFLRPTEITLPNDDHCDRTGAVSG